jgi:hypothetical protein
METANKQPASPAAKNEGTPNRQTKTDTASKEPPDEGKEKLADNVTSDNDVFKSLLRQFTNPLTLLIATIAFFYWQYRKTAVKKIDGKTPPKEEAGTDKAKQLKKQKKKNKRLKKQLQYQQQGNNFRNGSYHEQMA